MKWHAVADLWAGYLGRSLCLHRGSNFLVALFLCVCGLLISGCSASKAMLTVQAFIVTAGRENIRLGLLTVHAAPVAVVQDAIKQHLARTQLATAPLKKELGSLRTEFIGAEKAMFRAGDQIKEANASLEQQKVLLGEIEASLAGDPYSMAGLGQASSRLVERIARESDDSLRRSSDLRSRQDLQKAETEYAKAMALNDAVKSIRLITEKRIEGRAPVDAMHEELVAFYSRDEFKEFGNERAAVLDALQAALAVNVDKKDKFAPMREKSLLAIASLEANLARLKKERAEVEATFRESSKRTVELALEVADLESRDRLFSALPEATVSKKTNPDGIVTFELSTGEQWVLWARTDRQMLAGSGEEYSWLVESPPASSWKEDEPFFLSNDNLLGPKEMPAFVGQ